MNRTKQENDATDGDAKRIFDQWHQSVVGRDLDALMVLYAEEAILETPLAYVASGERNDGTIRGKRAIRAFFGAAFEQPESGLGRWYRTGRYHAANRQLVWEYPRATPHGDQVELTEVIDMNDEGLIANHRVYWGWKGLQALLAVRRREA